MFDNVMKVLLTFLMETKKNYNKRKQNKQAKLMYTRSGGLHIDKNTMVGYFRVGDYISTITLFAQLKQPCLTASII